MNNDFDDPLGSDNAVIALRHTNVLFVEDGTSPLLVSPARVSASPDKDAIGCSVRAGAEARSGEAPVEGAALIAAISEPVADAWLPSL